MLTDEQIAQEVADINNDLLWPLFPILPMKTIGRMEEREHGIVISGSQTVVYHLVLYDLKAGESLGEQLKDVRTTTYESVEAMVRDGWIGD